MKYIKTLFLLVTLLTGVNTFANGISGIIKSINTPSTGTLYIFAKKFGSKMPMPIAVKRIDSPKFPLKFTLNESNKMMPDMPFVGPFTVVARLSPSGDAMDKSGPEVQSTQPIINGAKDIELTLK